MTALTDEVVAILKKLPARADAQLGASLVPIGSICWDDENPSWAELSDGERDAILRLFGIRFQIWDDEPLSAEDREFWEAARAQVPTFALFHHLKLSAEDREARKNAEEEANNLWDSFGPQLTEKPSAGGHFKEVTHAWPAEKQIAAPKYPPHWWKLMSGFGRIVWDAVAKFLSK